MLIYAVEAGYKVSVPSKKVDVLENERGVYRITENRYDNKKMKSKDLNKVDGVTVDPGLGKVVCVRSTPLEYSGSASEILEHSTVWDISSKQYREMAAYDMRRLYDSRRKKQCFKYRNAVHDLNIFIFYYQLFHSS